MEHVKTIFQTPYISLQTTRSFLLNRNGTYQCFHPPQGSLTSSAANGTLPQPVTTASGSSSSSSNSSSRQTNTTQQPLLIRPHEFRTVLRVGSSAYQPAAKATPFIIEWTPDALPLSKLGELRLRFEYEHVHNGQLAQIVPIAKDILTSGTSLVGQNSTNVAPNATTTTFIQNPILISNPTISLSSTSLANPSITNAKSSLGSNNSNSSAVAGTSNSNNTGKSGLTPIAPKTLPSTLIVPQLKDTIVDDSNAAGIIDYISQENFLDSNGYTTLLF